MILFRRILMTISALAMIIMLILNAAAFVIFGNMDYYRQEFEKYNVTQNIDISMDNIMYVMGELMDYLYNNRSDLENIETDVNGQQRDFFSDREKEHMGDCKVIFDNAFRLKTACTLIFIGLTLIMIMANTFDIRQFIKISGIISFVIILFTVIVAVAAVKDFNTTFIIFHKLFFNNNLWLLDPKTDLIINILVEEFFADIALKIGIYSMSAPGVLVITGLILHLSDKKRRNV